MVSVSPIQHHSLQSCPACDKPLAAHKYKLVNWEEGAGDTLDCYHCWTNLIIDDTGKLHKFDDYMAAFNQEEPSET